MLGSRNIVHRRRRALGAAVAVLLAAALPASAAAEESADATGKTAATARLIDIRDFGAKCDGQADDTQAIQDAFDAAHERRNTTVVIPDTGLPCLVKWHIEVGSGTTVMFHGSYLKADGVPMQAPDGACCKPGTDIPYNEGQGYRGGVLNLRRTGERTSGIVVINPLIDCNYEFINGVGVGSGYELGKRGLGPSAHEMLIVGGTVKNCTMDLTLGGGSGITAQRGVGAIRFVGTHVENCANGIRHVGGNRNTAELGICRIDGRECSDDDDCLSVGDACESPAVSTEYATNILYSSITMRNVGCAIEVLDFPSGATDDHNAWNAVINDISCHNCGDSSTLVVGTSERSRGDSANAKPDDRGVICFMGGANTSISHVNVTNEDWYPRIGAVIRGRTRSSVVSDVSFDGSARSIISGEVFDPDSSFWEPDRRDPWTGNLYRDIAYLGDTLDHVVDSAGARQCNSSCENWTASCSTDGDCSGCAEGDGCTDDPSRGLRNARNRFERITTTAEPLRGIVDEDSRSGPGVDTVFLDVIRTGDAANIRRSATLDRFAESFDNAFLQCGAGCANEGSPCGTDADCERCPNSQAAACTVDYGRCASDVCADGNGWQFGAVRLGAPRTDGAPGAALSSRGKTPLALNADDADGVSELSLVPGAAVKAGVPFVFATMESTAGLPEGGCAWIDEALVCKRGGRVVRLTPSE